MTVFPYYNNITLERHPCSQLFKQSGGPGWFVVWILLPGSSTQRLSHCKKILNMSGNVLFSAVGKGDAASDHRCRGATKAVTLPRMTSTFWAKTLPVSSLGAGLQLVVTGTAFERWPVDSFQLQVTGRPQAWWK